MSEDYYFISYCGYPNNSYDCFFGNAYFAFAAGQEVNPAMISHIAECIKNGDAGIETIVVMNIVPIDSLYNGEPENTPKQSAKIYNLSDYRNT